MKFNMLPLKARDLLLQVVFNTGLTVSQLYCRGHFSLKGCLPYPNELVLVYFNKHSTFPQFTVHTITFILIYLLNRLAVYTRLHDIPQSKSY